MPTSELPTVGNLRVGISEIHLKKSPTWRLELERDGCTVLEGVLSQSEVEVARLVTNHLWSTCQKRDFCSTEISGGWSRKSLGMMWERLVIVVVTIVIVIILLNLRQLVWEWLEGLGSGLVRDKPETWTDSAWPGGQNLDAKQARWSKFLMLNRPGGQVFGGLTGQVVKYLDAKKARWSNIWRLNRPGGQLFWC